MQEVQSDLHQSAGKPVGYKDLTTDKEVTGASRMEINRMVEDDPKRYKKIKRGYLRGTTGFDLKRLKRSWDNV